MELASWWSIISLLNMMGESLRVAPVSGLAVILMAAAAAWAELTGEPRRQLPAGLGRPSGPSPGLRLSTREGGLQRCKK